MRTKRVSVGGARNDLQKYRERRGQSEGTFFSDSNFKEVSEEERPSPTSAAASLNSLNQSGEGESIGR
ncbi:hypothetical protein Q7C36_009328 [Tachysurus vachellii]|uniref:Uncharacterized protein n=1 Tax=Tachysurus vachellii TaxID=175792 RepID=A0AA88N132_TACVA|nr:hypothetical protein Q7C36_009328 [Tachysurus vachellii]